MVVVVVVFLSSTTGVSEVVVLVVDVVVCAGAGWAGVMLFVVFLEQPAAATRPTKRNEIVFNMRPVVTRSRSNVDDA